MSTQHASVFTGRQRRRVFIATAVLTLLFAALAPQVDILSDSLAIMGQAALWPLLLAFLGTALTYILSAAIYHLLLKHYITFREVAVVQVATALSSKIVPIGIATMGLNAIFLRRRRHSLPEALAVVAVNNGLGIGGHIIILAIVSLYAPLPPSLEAVFDWHNLSWILLPLSVVIAVCTWSNYLWQRISDSTNQLLVALINYQQHRRQLTLALVTSIVLSIVYALILLACAQALGISLSFQQIFLVYTFSMLVGVITPTPGGLIGVEAGLVAGFVTYGLTADTALAIALLYRLVTYWVPLAPGLLAFRTVQQRYL